MFFIIRFDWDKINSTRSYDRIVGCFDTLANANKAISYLPYDEYRNSVAIVRFPINEIISCAKPEKILVYNDDREDFLETHEPYIGNQYFYM